MKKLIFAAVLAGAVLLAACSPNSPTGTPSPSESAPLSAVTPADTIPDDKPAQSSDMTDIPGSEQNIEEMREDLETMLPILDSIVRVTGIAGDTEYAPDDPEFIWMVLYLIGSNWGEVHPFVVPGYDGYTVIQMRVLYDFACAASSMYMEEVLPELPQSMENSVKYDAENDEYIFSPCDMGGTMTKLDDMSIAQDGTVIAIVGLYGGVGTPEDLLGSVSFTLVKKPNADGNRTSNYLYSVAGATKIPK